MTISRRTFILVTGLVPAAPLLAKLSVRSAHADSPSPHAPGQEDVAHGADANDLVLKIEGWELRESTPAAPAGRELWISVNRSWRTAWR